jgi:DNA polymerase I-like protein with 3'-5' exonuclease and polymerase domains
LDGSVKGGLSIGKDGAVHTCYTHNPSTLRSAAQNPPLQQLPRPSKDPSAPGNLIRNLIVAREGHTFIARDFSGIEAVLVGWFARLPDYIRLSKIDVHSFYTAYALNQLDGRVKANDLPLLSWDDAKLTSRLAEIKTEFKEDRNNLYKHLVHGGNFMQGPSGAAEKILLETGIVYPVTLVAKVMDIYKELFPGIGKWHRETLAQADKDGFLRNPFGYIHRFNRVYEWEKVGGVWQKSNGPESNKVIAFLPQSTAAGIIKEAMIRLYFDHYESAGRYLRLLIHDELMSEVPLDRAGEVDVIMKLEMEQPIKVLPLPASYGMGPYLVINTESKKGSPWGKML